MSSYSILYDSLIKLGIKPQLAHKIAKELMDKAKTNPIVSKKELEKEVAKLSEHISDLSSKDKHKKSLDYLHAIIQGVLAAGTFELLMQAKVWLQSIFMSSTSEEIDKMMVAYARIRHKVQSDVSSEVSDVISKNALAIESAKKEIIKSALAGAGHDSDDQIVDIVEHTLENLCEIVNFKYAVELGIIENPNKANQHGSK